MNLKMLTIGVGSGIAAMGIVVPAAMAADGLMDGSETARPVAASEPLRAVRLQAPGGETTTLPFSGRALRHGPGANVAQAAADVLGITVEELRAEMEAGQTSILGVAEGRGLDPAQFTADVTAIVRADIEEALANGEIDQEMADRLLDDLDEHVANALASTRLKGGPGCDGQGEGTPPADGSGSSESEAPGEGASSEA